MAGGVPDSSQTGKLESEAIAAAKLIRREEEDGSDQSSKNSEPSTLHRSMKQRYLDLEALMASPRWKQLPEKLQARILDLQARTRHEGIHEL
ncbi:MAG: hypothetical protein WCP20_05160 [Desulfuromonadales bacterium]